VGGAALRLQCAPLLAGASPDEPAGVALRDGALFHMVLPSVLPLVSHMSPAGARASATAAAAVAASAAAAGAGGEEEEAGVDPSALYRQRMSEVPAGYVGTMALLRNGHVVLKVGDLLYDVTAGVPRAMYEHCVAMTADTLSKDIAAGTPAATVAGGAEDGSDAFARRVPPGKRFTQCVDVGPFAATLLVSPSIDAMLAATAPPSAAPASSAAAATAPAALYAALADELAADAAAALPKHRRPRGLSRSDSMSLPPPPPLPPT